MSKVKGEIYDINKRKLIHINKRKLIHNLRRIETKKKKRSRIIKYRNGEYRCCRGYYLNYDYNIDEYKYGVHRINTNIKTLRKFAQRKVRYSPANEIYQRSTYKRLYDLDWTYV